MYYKLLVYIAFIIHALADETPDIAYFPIRTLIVLEMGFLASSLITIKILLLALIWFKEEICFKKLVIRLTC